MFNNKWETLTSEELDRILDEVFWKVFWKRRLNLEDKSNG